MSVADPDASVADPAGTIYYPPAQQDTRQCSVRGCSNPVPTTSTNKMCEVCRGRHRIYATTKRARRKLEKAVVSGGQGVNMAGLDGMLGSGPWMPSQSEQTQPVPPNLVQGRAETHGRPQQQQLVIAPIITTWDHSALDPRLLSPQTTQPHPQIQAHTRSTSSSLSSALAGALTLPAPAPVLSPPLPVQGDRKGYNSIMNGSNGGYHRALPESSPAQGQQHQFQVSPFYQGGEQLHMSLPPSNLSSSREKIDVSAALRPAPGGSSSTERLSQPLVQSPAQLNVDAGSGAKISQQQRSRITDGKECYSDDETGNGKENDQDEEMEGDVPSVQRRFCSVKGCKAVIPGAYPFKMCESCRDRYRIYGTTKRAKWKAERMAFDRELADLRIGEDEKRRRAGMSPLSESPEELRKWELSIIDEQVPLPPSVVSALSTSSKPLSDPRAGEQPLSAASPLPFESTSPSSSRTGISGLGPNIPTATETPMTSSGTTSLQSTTGANNPNSASPYPHLSNQFLMGPTLLHTSSGVPVAPPARMCTVSHCHKILPGFYRYKRCEQHRLQNRYHSKLKRVREKVVKAIGPGGSSVGSRTGGEEGEDHENNKGEGGSRNNGKGKGKEKEQEKEMRRKEKEEETQDDMEVPVMSVPIAADGGKVRGESKEAKKRNYTCISEGCCNLLLFGVRWRTCEVCRTRKTMMRMEIETKGQKETGTQEGTRVADPNDGMAAGASAGRGTGGVGLKTQGRNAEDEDRDEDKDDEGRRMADDEPEVDAVLNVDTDQGTMDLGTGEKPRGGGLPNPIAHPVQTARSTTTPLSTTLTSTLPPLIFKAYQPNMTRSNRAFDDSLGPDSTATRSASSLTLPPTKEPSISESIVPTSTPSVYQPLSKKSRKSADEYEANTPQSAAALGSGTPPNSAFADRIKSQHTAPPTPVLTPIPIPPALPPYPYVQYPVQYYVPSPYGVPSYAVAPPPPSSSSSSSSPSGPQSIPPYPGQPQQHPYVYPHLAYPVPPGYSYVPPQYMTPYGQPLPHHPQPYMAQLQPGTYPSAGYGYGKEPYGFYYASAPTLALPTPAFEPLPVKRKKRKRGDQIVPTESPPPPASPAITVSTTSVTPTLLPLLPAVSNLIPGVSDIDKVDEQPSEPQSQPRYCRNKTCHQAITAGISGAMCEKCRTRIKRHQAKTKQRLKLEPRKSMLNTTTKGEGV